MATESRQERRSLKYIRLAAHLARQPGDLARLEMSLADIEGVIGEKLPTTAKFPSWWRNDGRKMHSRAWLAAGWEVVEVVGAESKIVFVRRATPI